MSKFSLDSFLRILSLILFFVFIIFCIQVITKQILLPESTLLKIIDKNCKNPAGSLNSSLSNTFKEIDYYSEDEFIKSGNDCYFIKPDGKNHHFFNNLLSRTHLKKSDYLYISAVKGILVKKYPSYEKELASAIGECFINDNCKRNGNNYISNIRMTWTLAEPKGETKLTGSCEGSMENFTDFCKEEFSALVSLKKLDKTKLIFKIVFHRNEAYIDSKDKDFITSLIVEHIDGLTLKSRGADIKLLPDDAVLRPFSFLDFKARNYGLDKNEYLKEIASLYIYSTRQYVFYKNTTKEFYGPFSLSKKDYDDKIFLNANFGFLASVIDNKGSFNENISIKNGYTSDKKKHLISQMLIGNEISYYYKKTGSGRALLNIFREYASAKVLSLRNTVLDSIFISSFLNAPENDEKINIMLKELTTKLYFTDVEKFTDEHPVFAGLLARTFIEIAVLNNNDRKWIEKAERLYEHWNFPVKSDLDSVRSVSYMIPVAYSLGDKKWKNFYSQLKSFIAKNSRANFYWNSGFYVNGYNSIDMEVLLALELKKLADKGFHDSFSDSFISEIKSHIKMVTVLNEDITENTSSNRNYINGGVLPRIGSEVVSSVTSARSMNLFIN